MAWSSPSSSLMAVIAGAIPVCLMGFGGFAIIPYLGEMKLFIFGLALLALAFSRWLFPERGAPGGSCGLVPGDRRTRRLLLNWSCNLAHRGGKKAEQSSRQRPMKDQRARGGPLTEQRSGGSGRSRAGGDDEQAGAKQS